MITIKLDTHEIDTALSQLAKSTQDLHDPLDQIGDAIAQNIALLFNAHESPDGLPWEGLSDVTLQKRRKGPRPGNSQILEDSGLLKNSFTHNVSGNSVEIGTNVEYASTHQFGAKKGQYAKNTPWGDIPARPFLPEDNLPSDWEDEVLGIISDHLECAI